MHDLSTWKWDLCPKQPFRHAHSKYCEHCTSMSVLENSTWIVRLKRRARVGVVRLLGSAWDGELYGGWHLNLNHKLSKRYTRHKLSF